MAPARYGSAIYGVAKYSSAAVPPGGPKKMTKVALKIKGLPDNDANDKVEDLADTGGGGAAFIVARGFEVAGTGAPRMMAQVTGMAATPGDAEGKIHWMCDPQTSAIFLLQTSPDAMPRVWSDREPSKT